MKQAQSRTSRHATPGGDWPRGGGALRGWRSVDEPHGIKVRGLERPGAVSWVEVCLSVLGTVWTLVTLPLRLIFWTIAWVGRLAAILLGFSLMVVGIALWAGPLFFLGIPLFLVGLVLTLKSLG
jgi:hypothetical protein